MFDLFAEDSSSAASDEGSQYYNVKLEHKSSQNSDNYYTYQDAVDICSGDVLDKLAESNPNALLPHILPIANSDVKENDTNIFNKVGTHLLHIQMPSVLPALKRQGADESIYQSSKLDCLPSGRMGKLKVFKSGKIKLDLDGHIFSFSPGNRSTCKQQVACLLDENDEFLFLGDYHHRFVVYPDLPDDINGN